MAKRRLSKKEIVSPNIKTTEITPVTDANQLDKSNKFSKKIVAILGILVIVFLFIYFKTNLINLATVDGNPITRWELEKELNSKFADQTLDSLISEKIILSQAQKQGVIVDQTDIDKRTKEIEERLKGQISLDEALKVQGLNRDSFRKQIEIQIAIDKMFAREASISEKEIEDYISQNQDYFTNSTDPAKVRSEVQQTLKQQKIGELFDKWFKKIREKVKVVKF